MNNNKVVLLESIRQIRDLFEPYQIRYFIGGSMMLYLRGMEVEVHDIDIFVDERDYNTACDLLHHVAQSVEKEPNSMYQTTYFQKFLMGDVSIDIMAEFKVVFKEALFHYPTSVLVGEEVVHPIIGPMMLMLIEDWIVIYHVINRPRKVLDICSYFETHLPNFERIMIICNCMDSTFVSMSTYQEVTQAMHLE